MKIAPSILNAHFGHLQAEVKSLAAADRIHLDIMDGQYVPNLSFGANMLHGIEWGIPIEAHLMVDTPEAHIQSYKDLGCMGVTFHIENTGRDRALALLKQIKALNMKAGISIDGYTDPGYLTDELLNEADQVLIMSVKSGFGGQSFLLQTVDKIQQIRARGYTGEIEIDGGINDTTIEMVAAAGADICVVGSYLLKKPASDRESIIKTLQQV